MGHNAKPNEAVADTGATPLCVAVLNGYVDEWPRRICKDSLATVWS